MRNRSTGEMVDTFTDAARASTAEGALAFIQMVDEMTKQFAPLMPSLENAQTAAFSGAIQKVAFIYGQPIHVGISSKDFLLKYETEGNAILRAAEVLGIESLQPKPV